MMIETVVREEQVRFTVMQRGDVNLSNVKITSELFEAFCTCPTKCYLRSRGERGTGNAFAGWLAAQQSGYRSDGVKRLTANGGGKECPTGDLDAETLKSGKWRWAVNCTARAHTWESRLDVLERCAQPTPGRRVQPVPVRFVHAGKVTIKDKLLLAFDALVLAGMTGHEIPIGKLIHGAQHSSLKVRIPPWQRRSESRLNR